LEELHDRLPASRPSDLGEIHTLESPAIRKKWRVLRWKEMPKIRHVSSAGRTWFERIWKPTSTFQPIKLQFGPAEPNSGGFGHS
jgi:hypothetical protein